MGREDYIAITHFINPQLFWYHKIDAQTPGFKELQQIEESVQLLYTAKQSAALIPHRPIVGEVVAIAFLSWNKFIRARVVYVAKYTKAEDEYIVWALDYGFPFRTKRIYVRKLPESYAIHTDHIRQGGIANVIPADMEFDFLTTTNKLLCKRSWSKKPVEMLEKVMNDSASISFIEMFTVDGGPSGCQYFGDLKIVNHMGVEFMASKYLLKLNTAMEYIQGFKEKLATLKTTSIPCWQTNSGDMKIIENKLNTFNVDYATQSSFNLSGSLSEISCDNFAKQKVMDWRQRNQNLDKSERNAHPVPALNDLDASDFSFDDSVSVNNYKQQGLPNTYDDSFMGCAGGLHKSRKKKYHGKALPPKPSLELFEVIPEKPKHSGGNKDARSSVSAASAPSERTKALLELRKKLHKGKENTAQNTEEEIEKSSSQSETGTEEFLQICKEINAQSTRLAKLRELRTRRVNGSHPNSEVGQDNKEAKSNEGQCQENDDKSESCATSVKSSRLLMLERIKKKHSKQFVVPKEDGNLQPKAEDETRSRPESVVSTHAAKLISLRKKVQEKYKQEAQMNPITPNENESSKKSVPDTANMYPDTKQQDLKFIERVILDNDSELVSPVPFEDVIPSRSSEQKNSSGHRIVRDDRSTAANEVNLSGFRSEAELQKIRETLRSNPFKVMTMVPGGFDVTKLSKRNNEEEHWHTKKTTLNESAHSNQSSSAGYQHKNGSQDRSVARRTEHVEEQNFRFTRSRKERKKSLEDVTTISNASVIGGIAYVPTGSECTKSHGKSEDEKNILDESLTDDLVPAPTILPKPITPRTTREVPSDLMIFFDNDSIGEKPNDNTHEMSPIRCQEDKLIDLSGTGASTDLPDSESTTKSSPGREFLAISHVPSEDSFDLMHKETPEKTETLQNGNPQRNQTREISPILNSESSSTSAASVEADKPYSISNSEKHGILKSTSSSATESSVSMQRLLKSSLIEDECNKLTIVGSYKPCRSSSSSSSSFVKISPNESSAGNTPRGTELDGLPPVTRKWRASTSSISTKVSTSCTQPSAHTSSSGSVGWTVTNESNARLPQVAGETSLKTNLIDHLVLAHSHAKVTPIEKMTSAMFAPVVHREMENMRLTKMYRIQSYAWAHLIRGNSFFVINSARTGKSWCYLPPICSMVNYRSESNELPQSYGPVAVIIAPSSVQVENISRQCRRLLASSTTNISVVSSYAFRNTEDVKIELHNGCGILIITPPSLRRLLVANEKESLLNMERIQFVVLDDLDMMVSHCSEFSETLNKFLGPVLRQECGKVHFQLVVTSKRWSRQIVNLLKISSQPMLCIGDFLEAAVYAKAKISIKLQRKIEKMSVMMKVLQKCSYSVDRVVIVCNSVDEVDEVEKNLLEGGLACLPFTERTPVEYQNLIHEWKSKTISHEILVTTDSVLPELMIQNATLLIHYSLPTSWTKFNFRFSVFLQKHHNRIKNAFEKPVNFVKSVVLLDEENNIQLPRLIEFMKHHDQLKHIHPDIINVATRVTAEREEARVKNGILMCPRVLDFGSCNDSSRCSHRHQLTKYDVPSDGIPTEGEVRIKILEVHSPTHYIARLLSHKTDGTWKVVRRSNEVARFLMQMMLHFTNEGAQVAYWPLRVNDLCVYKNDTYHRCRILEAPHVVHENIVKVVNVKVKLIDTGSVIMCTSNGLLVIPEKFVDFPAQAVEIRLSGVKPFDNEQVWDTRSTRTVKSWIMTEVGDNDCLQASINFALMDTIWVHNVVLMEKLATIRGYAVKVNVRRSLVGKEFALVDDQEHIVKKIAQQNGLLRSERSDLFEPETSLAEPKEQPYTEGNLMEFSTSISEDKDVNYDSCKKRDDESVKVENSAPVPVKKSTVEAPSKPVEVWMQLGLDELRKIEIGEFKDPEQFYVRLTRPDKELHELESLIKAQKDPLEAPHPMQNCLAPRAGAYHRAKIQRLEVHSGEEAKARVFFCDLGEFSSVKLSELRCSNKELTELIPFQAIACKLAGIICKTPGEEIQNLLQKNNCVYFADAVKEITTHIVPAVDFHMHSYEIILYECFPEKYDRQINKLLVEQGLADYDPATKDVLEKDAKASFTRADGGSDEEPSTIDFQQLLDRMQSIWDEYDTESSEDEAQVVNTKAYPQRKENKIVEITADKCDYSMMADCPKVDSELPPLKALYVCPSTTWYQTMCMIYLVIRAADITDYFLEVSPKRLTFSASVGGELQVLMLDFLGYVDPKQMTHEIRGLNVVVRLVKSFYIMWPRLLETSTKYSWLTYNLNAIDTFQAEEMIEMQTSRPRNRLTSTSSETSDASSSNPCETFTPIVNYDQVYDPMVEMF